jgi:hypothetical protein
MDMMSTDKSSVHSSLVNVVTLKMSTDPREPEVKIIFMVN